MESSIPELKQVISLKMKQSD